MLGTHGNTPKPSVLGSSIMARNYVRLPYLVSLCVLYSDLPGGVDVDINILV